MSDTTPRRARTMAEFGEKMGALIAARAEAPPLPPYHPQASDVIISPFGKCGTTWLQQTFHTLRTRGDMDFDDISRVVPWIETSPGMGIDLNAAQRAEPRGYKSHSSYHMVPKATRYVIAFRDPHDAFVSMFRFMEGWFIEPGTISMEEFYAGWIESGPQGSNYWDHLLSWWDQRDNANVLLFSYAQMTADPAGHIRRLAAFCDITLDDDLLALTLDHSSIAYMLEHKDRFDDAMIRALSEARCGIPPGSDSAKVRRGGVGLNRAELSPELGAQIDAVWSDRVTPATGFSDYAAFEAALAEI